MILHRPKGMFRRVRLAMRRLVNYLRLVRREIASGYDLVEFVPTQLPDLSEVPCFVLDESVDPAQGQPLPILRGGDVLSVRLIGFRSQVEMLEAVVAYVERSTAPGTVVRVEVRRSYLGVFATVWQVFVAACRLVVADLSTRSACEVRAK